MLEKILVAHGIFFSAVNPKNIPRKILIDFKPIQIQEKNSNLINPGWTPIPDRLNSDYLKENYNKNLIKLNIYMYFWLTWVWFVSVIESVINVFILKRCNYIWYFSSNMCHKWYNGGTALRIIIFNQWDKKIVKLKFKLTKFWIFSWI